MQNGVDFYGFHQNHGSWRLHNADGSLHDLSLARVEYSFGTGRLVVIARENAVGTVFLRYHIHEGVYNFDRSRSSLFADNDGYMRPCEFDADGNLLRQGDVRHTAVIQVNITPVIIDIPDIPITPVYNPLWRIDMVDFIDSIDLANRARFFIDRIELQGRTQRGTVYEAFNQEFGRWVLFDADGELHDGSIATITPAVGTGRMQVVASDSDTGTVFMRFLIDGNYFPNGQGGFLISDDLRSTAIIPINVKPSVDGDDGSVFIRNRERDQSNRRYGIIIAQNPVSDIAKISVITPEQATITLRILDNLGNVVFTETAAYGRVSNPPLQNANDNAIIWNLTNPSGRFVANGAYLIIAEATGISGRRYLYSSRIGVNR
jgi:hypothetical protein